MIKKIANFSMVSLALLFSCFSTTIYAEDSKIDKTDTIESNKDNNDSNNEKPNESDTETKDLPPDGTLNVVANIDKRWELPLTVTADKPVFYFNSNINPGDTLSAKVIFSNPTSEPVQFTISDIINELSENTKSVELLNQLNFDISIDGSPIYSGLASQITMPVMGWLELLPNEKITLDIRYTVPKEMDNEFQAAKMNLKYVLTVRADVPPDPEEDEDFPEWIQTSVDTVKENPLIITAVLLGFGILCSTIIIYRKKKESHD